MSKWDREAGSRPNKSSDGTHDEKCYHCGIRFVDGDMVMELAFSGQEEVRCPILVCKNCMETDYERVK